MRRRESKRREEKRRGREEKRREEREDGVWQHTVSWACTRGAIFFAWCSDVTPSSKERYVSQELGLGSERTTWMMIWPWPRSRPATSAAAWLLGGIWGMQRLQRLRRGNLGGGWCSGGRLGRMQLAIKLFRLGMLGLWGCAGAERL